jgi:hypothetical protein
MRANGMNLRCEIVPCLRFTDAHNETERRWPSSQFQSRVISWANRTLPPGKVRVGGDSTATREDVQNDLRERLDVSLFLN